MKFYLCIVLVYAIFTATNGENGAKVEENLSKADQFPYQVSLRTDNGSHVCSGVILDERLILTSARCVRTHSPKYAVVGVHGKNDAGLRIGLDRIKVHESYKASSPENNIALIRTSYHMEFSSSVKPVGLTSHHWSADDKLSYRLSGWSQTEVIHCKNKELNSLQFELFTWG